MKNMLPKVSVLMPIYNTDSKFLRESIESILSQTFKDFEFLILNDSPENILLDEIVLSFSDDRIHYFKNECNKGITFSRNKLINMAKGEYIAIFDHDDVSLPGRLEKEVNFLDGHPDIGCVSGCAQFIGSKKKYFCPPEMDTDIRIMMTADNYIFHTASMIRKSILDQYKIRYNNAYFPAEDYKLYADLLDVTKCYNLQETLVLYRVHQSNTSKIYQKKSRYMAKTIRLEFANRYISYRKEYENVFQTFNIKLFGFIPLLKSKYQNGRTWIYLFNILPILKIKK